MEKNYICKINGIKYNLKDVYELLIEYGCGEQAQALLREEIGLKGIPAWRLAEQIKRTGEIPRTFSGELSRPSIPSSVPINPNIVFRITNQNKRTETIKESPPQRRYSEDDYQRDLYLRQFGKGSPQLEADQRAYHWEHGRDPYNKAEIDNYHKELKEGNVSLVIAAFAIIFFIVILLGIIF